MNDQIPDFMRRKAAPRGTEGAGPETDRAPLKSVAPVKMEMADNLRLNSTVITRDNVIELSKVAIEKVTWRLPSTPYGVQAHALNTAGDSIGFGYFLEQGLGKTKLTLADYWNRYEKGLNNCMIIVTINSMKLTWLREMTEAEYPFDIHVWPNVKDFPDDPKGQVLVINFDAIRGRGFRWIMTWVRRCKAFLVIDESTGVANHNSAQGKKAFELAAVCTASRALAGLPNPNGPHDLYNQLRCLRIPVRMVPKAFRNRFCEIGGHKNQVVIGTKNEAELAQMMAGRVWFADKDTWAPTLPKRLYTERVVEMTPAQKDAYRTMVRELYAEVEGGVVSIEQAIAKSTKLQQIAAGYIYGQDRQVHIIGKGEDPKLDAVKEYLQHTDGKTIIFAHFRHSVSKLIEAFPDCAYALSKQHMSDEELERQKDRFNNDPDCTKFVAPISVMQYGHTIIGSPTHPCTGTIYYENTYSRLARSQSQDRNHRWGASEKEGSAVVYCDIICSPIDRAVINRLKSKGEMANALLSALKEVLHNGI